MELSKKEQWRNKYLENIQKDGLQIEEEIVEQGKKAFVFLKIHATWPVLCHYAEELSMRAPLMVFRSTDFHFQFFFRTKVLFG